MLELVFNFLSVLFSPDTGRLAEAVHKYAPREVSADVAWFNTVAAKMAESEDVPASLLLSMAYSESRYNPYSVSHVRDGKRQWGIFRTSEAPPGVSGPYFCGVTQVIARNSWKKCMEYRNISTAYRTAVRELTTWLKICRNKEEKMRCALFGYGGGFPAIEAAISTYPTRLLSRARILERSAAPAS